MEGSTEDFSLNVDVFLNSHFDNLSKLSNLHEALERINNYEKELESQVCFIKYYIFYFMLGN